MTIHAEHPFADQDPARDAVRQLRGRLGGVVALWTAGDLAVGAGLTVSSMMVIQGEPGRVVAALDPLSDLVEHLQRTGRGTVQLLTWQEKELADVFAGRSPAPGGPFRSAEFTDTAWGPRLAGRPLTWAGVSLETAVEVGWSLQVTCVLERVEVADDHDPLVHRRGLYRRASDS